MRQVPTSLPGVFVIEPEEARDERGSFARTFCRELFTSWGLDPRVEQCSLSRNRTKGGVRGLHYQVAPHAEAKLVRCVRGAIFDVVVDLREASPTRLRWISVELDADSARAVYIPEGCAHGFQTLSDDAEVYYQISAPYVPEAARGVRFDDPALAIAWPLPVSTISARDAAFPPLVP